MSIEVFGFFAGLACVVAGGIAFLKLETWRANHDAYGRKPVSGRRGNALIWPSR